MIQGRSDIPDRLPIESSVAREAEIGGAVGSSDCRTCELRPRCISYGWMSPGGIWFENAVILAPKPGCRGFVGRSGDIRSRFLTRRTDVEH